MCFRFHLTNYTTTRKLRNRVQDLYADAFRGEDGVSYGGDTKLEVMLDGRIPFKLQNGSVGQPRGLHSLLVALSKLYGEHYAWLQATSQLPVKVEAEVCPRPQVDVEEEEVHPDMPPGSSIFLDDDDASDDLEPPRPRLSEAPKPVLDYAHVHSAFRQALKGNWIDDPKVQDRFALFNTLNAQPVVTKRRSNGSSEQKEKRSRQASQSNAGGTIASHGASLHSIGE